MNEIAVSVWIFLLFVFIALFYTSVIMALLYTSVIIAFACSVVSWLFMLSSVQSVVSTVLSRADVVGMNLLTCLYLKMFSPSSSVAADRTAGLGSPGWPLWSFRTRTVLLTAF